MTTYKKINFKRDYETINVKFIQILDNEIPNPEIWVECNESEINCDQLWKEGNKILYGYL